MRVAAAGLWHESNTFIAEPTTYGRFEEDTLLRGEEIVRSEREAHSTMAGLLALGDLPDVELVPLLLARAIPGGTVTDGALNRIVAEILALLESGGPWDAVLLGLHGAAVAESYPDADAEIAERVRAAVGEQVPIGVALDMHANVSPRLIANVNATTIYRTNPHIDAREQALACGEIIVRAVRGEVAPAQAFVPIPAAVNILRQSTLEDPMRSIMGEVDAVAQRPRMLSASLAEGYPYADVPAMGMSVITVHDGSAAAAAAEATRLAERVWRDRAEFDAAATPVDEALVEATRATASPSVLLDVGDNVGGGAPGDSTVILGAALRLQVSGLLMILVDPEAVRNCAHAGAGQAVAVEVGGKLPMSPGKPVAVSGRVRRISEGRFEEPSATHGGFRHFDGGTTAVLDTDEGNTLVLISKRVIPVSIRQLTTLDIDPRAYAIIVAKGVQSPRASYDTIAGRVVMVDTPGVTAADLSRLSYQRRLTPLYPFEPVPQYRPEAVVTAPFRVAAR